MGSVGGVSVLCSAVLRACSAFDEDQSMRGMGNPANSAMFVVVGVDEKHGCAPAWCSNLR